MDLKSHHQLVRWGIVGALLLGLVGTVAAGCGALRNPFDAKLQEVSIQVEMPPTLTGTVVLVPHAKAVLEEFSGTLTLQGETIPHEIEGVEPGMALEPDEALLFKVTAHPSAIQTMRLTATTLRSQKIDVAFEGTAVVRTRWIQMKIPISLSEDIRLTR